MPSFFSLIRDICLLRRGPQDLPYSVPLLVMVAIAFVVLRLGLAIATGVSLGMMLAGALLWLLYTLGTLNLILSLRGLRNRFVQAATALLGCTLAFDVLSAPLALLLGDLPKVPTELTGVQSAVILISAPLGIWNIVVVAHVFRTSFGIPFLSAGLFALLWIVSAAVLVAAAGAPAAG